jgi:hypothetical protein
MTLHQVGGGGCAACPAGREEHTHGQKWGGRERRGVVLGLPLAQEVGGDCGKCKSICKSS